MLKNYVDFFVEIHYYSKALSYNKITSAGVRGVISKFSVCMELITIETEALLLQVIVFPSFNSNCTSSESCMTLRYQTINLSSVLFQP